MRRQLIDLLAPGLLTGVFGLAGVLIGSWIATRGQKKERQLRHILEQLERFYYPMVGLRAKQVAKSQVRTKVSGAVDAASRKLVDRFAAAEAPKQAEALATRMPDFEKAVEENNRQLIEGILPLYRQMVDIFTANMGLAEPSTREHYGTLVEFIEIWDRWLQGTLAPEVLEELKHSEDTLKPFYQDLFDQLAQLQARLKE